MSIRSFFVWFAIVIAVGCSPNSNTEQTTVPTPGSTSDDSSAAVAAQKEEYSHHVDDDSASRVFFGDTHVHTSYSTDAGMFGTRLGPEEAYRFALGEEVTSNTGLRVRMQRPMDFLVIADHSENLGLAPMIAESNPELLNTEWGRMVHDLVKSGKGGEAYNAWIIAMGGEDPLQGNDAINRSMWEQPDDCCRKIQSAGQVYRLDWRRVVLLA